MNLEQELASAFTRHEDDAEPNPWAWEHVASGVRRAHKRRMVATTGLGVAIVVMLGLGAGQLAGGAKPDTFANPTAPQTFAFSGKIHYDDGSGSQLDGRNEGVVDLEHGLLRLTLKAPYGGELDHDLTFIQTADRAYVQLSEDEQRAVGKPWLSVPIDEALIGYTAQTVMAPLGDPGSYLAALSPYTASTEELGSAEVNGEPTTRTRIMFDVKAAATEAPAPQRPIFREILDGGARRIPIDVYIGDDGLLRRVHVIARYRFNGHQTLFETTTDLHAFGTPVTIEVPDRSQLQERDSFIQTYMGTQTCASISVSDEGGQAQTGTNC